MSADNGIYILITPSQTKGAYEYRVEHLQSVENYTWDEVARKESSDPNVHIRNARHMWGRSPIFLNREDALAYASELLEEVGYAEYGISFIRIPIEF